MKNSIKNITAIIGLVLFGLGTVNATSSADCGDGEMQPITTHTNAKAKEEKKDT